MCSTPPSPDALASATPPEHSAHSLIMKIDNTEYGKFTSPAEVRIVRLLPGPIERAWEYLTDPEKRALWFGGGPMELKAGGEYTIHFKHKNLAPGEDPPEAASQVHDPGVSFSGKVLRCDPPRLLSFTFDEESEVTFELTPKEEKVLLVLTHRSRGANLPNLADYASGWHTHLVHLVALLEGAQRPPFWALSARLKDEYASQLRTLVKAGISPNR
jgi:uncharacterized protein YndB with AHSA1/START domain